MHLAFGVYIFGFYLELVVVNAAALAGGRLVVGGGRLLVAHVHLFLLLVLQLLALGRLGRLLKPHHQLDSHNLTNTYCGFKS